MAKHTAYLHIGPGIRGVDAPHEALVADPHLAACGVVVPAVDQADMDRADIEIRRRHKALGLRRKDVEGSWALVCREAFRSRSDVLISQPGFVDAEFQQVALALDGLVGLQVHLVVTPSLTPDADELADLVGPWAKFVRKPERLHVLPVGDDASPHHLGARLARLLLLDQESDVDRRLVTMRKRRRRIRDRLTGLGATA